ncbi:MAG: hypothetical protein LWX56_06010 [Ignavibacteria bacterium]|nr:hypothetical protein [Ignavibacteria bacterium]
MRIMLFVLGCLLSTGISVFPQSSGSLFSVRLQSGIMHFTNEHLTNFQEKSNFIPLGLALEYRISKRAKVFMECNYISSRSDYLYRYFDIVSGNYTTVKLEDKKLQSAFINPGLSVELYKYSDLSLAVWGGVQLAYGTVNTDINGLVHILIYPYYEQPQDISGFLGGALFGGLTVTQYISPLHTSIFANARVSKSIIQSSDFSDHLGGTAFFAGLQFNQLPWLK